MKKYQRNPATGEIEVVESEGTLNYHTPPRYRRQGVVNNVTTPSPINNTSGQLLNPVPGIKQTIGSIIDNLTNFIPRKKTKPKIISKPVVSTAGTYKDPLIFNNDPVDIVMNTNPGVFDPVPDPVPDPIISTPTVKSSPPVKSISKPSLSGNMGSIDPISQTYEWFDNNGNLVGVFPIGTLPPSKPSVVPTQPTTVISDDYFEKRHKNGNVSVSWDYYLDKNDEKVKHGNHVNFYKDASKKMEGQWEHGKKVGSWNYYDEDGNLDRVHEYDEQGNKKNTTYYNPDGTIRDLDKEKADRDWAQRKNTLDIYGTRVDLTSYTDAELIEQADSWKDIPKSVSSATVPFYKDKERRFREEIQIRKDADRWSI